MIVTLDEEFSKWIPQKTDAEFEQLRKEITDDGCILNPLIMWRAPDGCDVLVDGHNRYRIYKESNPRLPDPEIKYKEFPDRDAVKRWMLDQAQVSRMSPDQGVVFRAKHYGELPSEPTELMELATATEPLPPSFPAAASRR